MSFPVPKNYDEFAEAMQRFFLGPNWRAVATAWPLMARGEAVNPDRWCDPVPPAVRSRAGNPEIVVYSEQQWVCSVVVSPTGRNPTVFVRPDVRVVEVDDPSAS